MSDELVVRLIGDRICSDPSDFEVSMSFNEGNFNSPTSVGPTVPGAGGPVVRLLGAAPNPFNPMTVISYELMAPSPVRLDVFDVSGRRVTTLVDGAIRAAGTHNQRWNGTDVSGVRVASGVYLVRLEVGDVVQTGRVVLLK